MEWDNVNSVFGSCKRWPKTLKNLKMLTDTASVWRNTNGETDLELKNKLYYSSGNDYFSYCPQTLRQCLKIIPINTFSELYSRDDVNQVEQIL